MNCSLAQQDPQFSNNFINDLAGSTNPPIDSNQLQMGSITCGSTHVTFTMLPPSTPSGPSATSIFNQINQQINNSNSPLYNGQVTRFSVVGQNLEATAVTGSVQQCSDGSYQADISLCTKSSDCVYSNWTTWTTCPLCGNAGNQWRNRTAITKSSLCNDLSEIHSCTYTPCPIDCVLSNWTQWTQCSPSCGNGTQTRSRTILTQPQYGGQKCNDTFEQQNCDNNNTPCPSTGSIYITSTYVSDSGLSIYIKFNTPSNQYGSSSGTNFNCSLIINEATVSSLGLNPICLWQSTSFLEIVLGQNAFIQIGNPILFLSDKIKDNTNTISLFSLQSTLNPPQNMATLIITANIIGPNRVAYCAQNINLDGGNSRGNFGRLLSYSWDLSGVGFVGNTTSLVINATNLNSNQNYTYQLTITNWIGQSNSTTMNIFIEPEIIPTLTIPASPISIARGNSEVALKTVLTESCPTGNKTSYLYNWAQIGGSIISTGIDQKSLKTSTLYIVSNALTPGETYTFRCTVSTSSGANSYIDGIINVLNGELKPSISGGSRQVSTLQSIIVNASLSYDSDTPSITSDSSLVYRWSCLRSLNSIDGPASIPCFSSTLANKIWGLNPMYLNISTSDWEDQGTSNDTLFVFTVVISKGSRNASTSVNIYPQPRKFIPITITPPKSDFDSYNTANNIRLTTSLGDSSSGDNQVSNTNMTYTWNVVSNNLNISEKNVMDPHAANLVLLPGALQYGTTYTFSVTAYDSVTGTTSTSFVNITTVYPPKNGYCGPSPASGVAYQTIFQFSCDSWVSSQLPLSYSFYLVPVDDGKPVLLSDWAPERQVAIKLPGGNRTILAYIRDAVGATTTFPFSVQVDAVNLTANGGLGNFTAGLMDDLLKSSLVSGNLDGAGQGIVLISDLLQSSRDANEVLTEEDFKLRSAIRTQLFDGLVTLNNQAPEVPSAARRTIELIQQVTNTPDELSPEIRLAPLSLSLDLSKNLLTNRGDENLTLIGGTHLNIFSNVIDSFKTPNSSSTNQTEYKSVVTHHEDTLNIVSQAISMDSVVGEITKVSSGSIDIVNSRVNTATNQLNSLSIESGLGSNVEIKLPTSFITSNPTKMDNTNDILFATTKDLYSTLIPVTSGAFRSPLVTTISIRDTNGNTIPIKDTTQMVENDEEAVLKNKVEVNVIEFDISIPSDTNFSMTGMAIKCQYLDTKTGTYKTDGCRSKISGNKTTCICNHLTSFNVEWSKFIPQVNPLSADDFMELTPENVRANPTTLIGIMLFLGVYLILMPFAYKRDQREQDPILQQEFLEKWKQKVSMEGKGFARKALNKIKEEHMWIGMYFRSFGDEFKSTDRVTTLFVMLYVDMALNAVFWGQTNDYYSDAVASVCSGIVVTIFSELITTLFLRAGEESLRNKFKYERDLELHKNFPDTYEEPEQEKRWPAYFRIIGYIVCFIIAIGCALVSITYGVRFDRIRQLAAPTEWDAYENQLYSAVILKETYDSLDVCQQSCMDNPICDVVMVREGDNKCFEMGDGKLVPITNPSLPQYTTYILTTTGPTTTKQWMLSSFYGALYDMLFDAVLIVSTLVIVYLITRRKIKRKETHIKELLERERGNSEPTKPSLIEGFRSSIMGGFRKSLKPTKRGSKENGTETDDLVAKDFTVNGEKEIEIEVLDERKETDTDTSFPNVTVDASEEPIRKFTQLDTPSVIKRNKPSSEEPGSPSQEEIPLTTTETWSRENPPHLEVGGLSQPASKQGTPTSKHRSLV